MSKKISQKKQSWERDFLDELFLAINEDDAKAFNLVVKDFFNSNYSLLLLDEGYGSIMNDFELITFGESDENIIKVINSIINKRDVKIFKYIKDSNIIHGINLLIVVWNVRLAIRQFIDSLFVDREKVGKLYTAIFEELKVFVDNYSMMMYRRNQLNKKLSIINKIDLTILIEDIVNSILMIVQTTYRHLFQQKFLKVGNDLDLLNRYKALAAHGEKFKGKQLTKDTIEAYKNIFKKNDIYKNQYGKDNFRAIAFNVARIQMKLDHTSEQENFYNSFKQFKFKHKLNDIDDFEKYLKENGYYT